MKSEFAEIEEAEAWQAHCHKMVKELQETKASQIKLVETLMDGKIAEAEKLEREADIKVNLLYQGGKTIEI